MSPRSQRDYQFPCDDLDQLLCCLHERGFAVAKQVIDAAYVERLKDSITRVLNPHNDLPPGGARTHLKFVEHSPELLSLLRHQPFMKISEAIFGSDQLTVHRSAAIMRMPPAKFGGWHTDQSMSPTVEGPNDVLNCLDRPNGNWFYLNGSGPGRCGIAVIEGSHRPAWTGPEGYRMVNHGKSFRPANGGDDPEVPDGQAMREISTWEHPLEMAVPGAVAVEAEPGDLILFANLTYHSAMRTEIDEPRLSCAIGFRPRGPMPNDVPWPLDPHAQRFVDSVPADLRPYFEHYVSIDPDWTPTATT